MTISQLPANKTPTAENVVSPDPRQFTTELIQDKPWPITRATRLGQTGRSRFQERFSLDRVLQQLHAVYTAGAS